VKSEIERLEGTPKALQQLLHNGSIISGLSSLGSAGALPDSICLSLVRLDPQRLDAARAVAEGRVELENLSEDLRNDHVVVLAAVKADGFSLQHAGDTLRSDRSIILAALHETGLALQFAPEEAQMDRSIVLEAVNRQGLAIQFAHISLRRDAQLVLAALEERGRALPLARKTEELREATRRILDKAGPLLENRGFMLAAISFVSFAFEHRSTELASDREITLAAVTKDPEMMCFTAEDLTSDKDFMISAIKANALTFPWAAPRLQLEPELLSAAAQKCPEAFALARGRPASLQHVFRKI